MAQPLTSVHPCAIWIPAMCSLTKNGAYQHLLSHEVLSDDAPICWSCMEEMTLQTRQVDGDCKCETSACYQHPTSTCPREARTPLHSQVRQDKQIDSIYKAVLETCYLVSVKVPQDAVLALDFPAPAFKPPFSRTSLTALFSSPLKPCAESPADRASSTSSFAPSPSASFLYSV